MSRPWIKLWTEIFHDMKLRGFTTEEFGLFVKLLIIAEEIGRDGLIPGRASRGGFSREELANYCKVSRKNLLSFVKKGVDKGIIARQSEDLKVTTKNDDLLIVNFEKRQRRKPADTPERTRERKQKSREKLSHLVTPHVTPHVTPIDKDKDKEGIFNKLNMSLEEEEIVTTDRKGEAKTEALAVANPSSSEINNYLDTVKTALVGSHIAPPADNELVKVMNYGLSEVLASVKIAQEAGKLSWGYVQGVIEGKQRDKKSRRSNGRKSEPGDKEAIKKTYGHLIQGASTKGKDTLQA